LFGIEFKTETKTKIDKAGSDDSDEEVFIDVDKVQEGEKKIEK
jgi:hypothetical protein